MNESKSPAGQGNSGSPGFLKLSIVMVILLIAGFGYVKYGHELNLTSLAEREGQLRAYQQENAVVGALLAFGVYVTVTGLSLPGAAVLTLALGWLLGFSKGLLVVSFASTTGATLAFLFSRFLLRESVMNRFGERLSSFNQALQQEGPFYLFTLRLIPVVPFFIINLVMGLTPIRTWSFWWISQIGMLPATAVYVYAGSTFPSLEALAKNGVGGILSPQLIIAFALLGLFPIVVKKLLGKRKPAPTV